MPGAWSSEKFRSAVVDGVTALAGVLTLILGGWVTWERVNAPPTPGARVERDIMDWRELAEPGIWLGARDAPVTIVAFGDYECPFCRELEPSLAAVRRAYPEDVALVYRHFPLPIHQHAYRAARLAECGREQRAFEDVHRLLYEVGDLRYVTAESILEELEIGDPDAFRECGEASGEVERIERDVEAALAAEFTGTPTVIINGRMLATLADSVELFERIDRLLELNATEASRR